MATWGYGYDYGLKRYFLHSILCVRFLKKNRPNGRPLQSNLVDLLVCHCRMQLNLRSFMHQLSRL